MHRDRSESRRKGFTILELLVVIAIIGILSAVVLASLNSARGKAKIAAAQSELVQLRLAMHQLSDDTGLWPGDQTPNEVCSGSCASNEVWDLSAGSAGLVSTDGSYPGWAGPYISSVPKDPWGNNYFLDTDYLVNASDQPCNGGSGCVNVVALGSFGPDGIGQNVYNADDVILILTH